MAFVKQLCNAGNNYLLHLIKMYADKKYLAYKIGLFAGLATIILGLSFGVRDLVLNQTERSFNLIPNFLNFRIVQNQGIVFGGLNSADPGLVYTIQIIPVVVSFVVFVSLRSYWLDVGLACLFFGGLANVIDRFLDDNYTFLNIPNTQNAVVDYLAFHPNFIGNSAVFNIPDVIIIVGIITIVLKFVVNWLIYFKQKKKWEQEPIEQPSELVSE